MYPQAESLATHGRAMYFRNGETVGFGNLDCLAALSISMSIPTQHWIVATRQPPCGVLSWSLPRVRLDCSLSPVAERPKLPTS